jgi:accessory colonization factor AcfC
MAPIIALANDNVYIYGPGGPAPAIKASSFAYTEKHQDTEVFVDAGPTGNWLKRAQTVPTQADIVFSGSEAMLDDFRKDFNFVEETTIFARPSALLVRKGNPKDIKGIKDILGRQDVKVMVVQGAGQVGMWEDVIGRTGQVQNYNLFKRLMVTAPNSGVALQKWKDKNDKDNVDVWLIWNHWQITNDDVADAVAIEPEYTIHRPATIALTDSGSKNKQAIAVYKYFTTDLTVTKIFKGLGWQTQW